MNNEKLNLYNKAKEAYYNGNPIMEDFEFDALEKELGLENKSYVGTKHNPSYTEKHPVIMGSLSKVQIHEKDGVIDWNTYYTEAKKYWSKAGESNIIITPKFDGCSFEAYVKAGNIISISSRGDGEYGIDLYKHLINKVKRNICIDRFNEYILRGEVLINKKIFTEKYSDFVNPRSFVAGILNRDFDSFDDSFLTKLNDLSIVIYDVRGKDETGWHDYDWTHFDFPDAPEASQILSSSELTVDKFEEIYNDFSNYRNNCEYALDGIVFKPVDTHRLNNLTERRPKDCIAVKFIPMLQETEIIDIEWNLGKTGEYIPVIITNPVIMDGKTITRASGHNYGYMLDNKISIGSRVILSLAGDIIPFIYKITNTGLFDEDRMNIPNNTYCEGCHLMSILSDEEVKHIKFISSVNTLNIPNLGPAEAENIWNYINQDNGESDDFFGFANFKVLPDNILLVSSEDVYLGIVFGTKNGATGKANKIKKSFNEVVKNITLKDIIKSCNFTACGDKVAEQCAEYLINGNADFTHLAAKGYEWCLKENNIEDVTNNLSDVMNIINILGKSFEDFKTQSKENTEVISNQIPVILTGEPNDYATKGEFMKYHPEYRITGKWTEVQIVFTNSLDSNTGKMKKAREKGIEIRLY